MIDALVFPDVRGALFDLIDGAVHLGNPVRAVYHVPADEYGTMQGPFPVARISVIGGTQGFIDRVDRVTVEVYAPGEVAVNTLESIAASIVGSDIETPSAYLDGITLDQIPVDTPYPSETLNRAVATFLVTSRPL